MARRTYAAVRAAERSARAELASVRDGAPRLPGNRAWLALRPAYRRLAAAEAERAQLRRSRARAWDELAHLELGARVADWPNAPRPAGVRKARRSFGGTVAPRRRKAQRVAELRAIAERRAAGTIRMGDID